MAKVVSDPDSSIWDEHRSFDSWEDNRAASARWHPNKRVYFCSLTLGGKNIAYEEFKHWGQARQFCELYMETGSVSVPQPKRSVTTSRSEAPN
jgi:hypothetical protein